MAIIVARRMNFQRNNPGELCACVRGPRAFAWIILQRFAPPSKNRQCTHAWTVNTLSATIDHSEIRISPTESLIYGIRGAVTAFGPTNQIVFNIGCSEASAVIREYHFP